MDFPKSTTKLKAIHEVENQMREKWKKLKCFESDAKEGKTKYMMTFPYPYMNGLAHLGHMYSLSKCEFTISFRRLIGENCLFPFAFHCTGMPIKVSCDRLSLELSEGVAQSEKTNSTFVDPEKELENKMKSRRSKASSKIGGKQTQYETVRDATQLDDVSEFTQPTKWIEFFPKQWKSDLDRFGAKVDWRRSFVTTDINPFYDSFVCWFITKLRKYIHFGKRYTIYSPKDEQPCMDHDRSSGEGLSYTEFTLIKYKLEDNLFLIAATRRPETMYGQVCCWVHPNIEYIQFTVDGTGYIADSHALRNIQHQYDNVVVGRTLRSSDLIGRTVQLPYSNRIVPILPYNNVKNDMGTGIVASVPSDSPDDYMALLQAKKNDKLGDLVKNIEPIPVVVVGELGTMSAPTLCEQFGVKGVNDSEPLGKASQIAYSRGFHEGIMAAGKYSGMCVQEARPLIKEEMIKDGYAMNYAEPDGRIISRSGDVCVVALCDQWYIDYGNAEWKQSVRELVGRLNLTEQVRNNFVYTIDNLHEHAMSRSYGLGSRVPWDRQYLIESLSDSTVYNAFYTVCHLLQGNIDGSERGPFGIEPRDMTHQVWDYIFYNNTTYPSDCSIDKAHLDAMKREFNYWYPVDLRTSGKDLIQNHLTYYLYTHIAVWPEEPDKWPRGIRANGLLLLNNEKMSKSTGNFMTLRDCCSRFSADATRLTLADAGDTIDDANFNVDTANAILLRLHSYLEFCRDVLSNPSVPTQFSIIDQAFESSMLAKVEQTYTHYYNGQYKDAVKTGFFEFMNLRDLYRDMSSNYNLMVKFIKIQTMILSPVCPHLCDYIWTELLHNPNTILSANWNSFMTKMFPIKPKKLDGVFPYIARAVRSFSKAQESSKRKNKCVDNAVIWVSDKYTDWQCRALEMVRDMIATTGSKDKAEIAHRFNSVPELSPYTKKLMPFINSMMPIIEQQINDGSFTKNGMLKCSFDEFSVLEAYLEYLRDKLRVRNLVVRRTGEMCDNGQISDKCYPNNPVIMFDQMNYTRVRFINRDRYAGFFEEQLVVFSGDSCVNVCDRMITRLSLNDQRVSLSTFDGNPITPDSLFDVDNGQVLLNGQITKNLVYSVY